MYYYGVDLATAEGILDGQAQQDGNSAHISGLDGVLSRVQVRSGELRG